MPEVLFIALGSIACTSVVWLFATVFLGWRETRKERLKAGKEEIHPYFGPDDWVDEFFEQVAQDKVSKTTTEKVDPPPDTKRIVEI